MGKDYVKKQQWGKKRNEDGFQSEDNEVVSDKEDVMSVDSEEEALEEAKNSRKVGKVQDRDDTRNKLRLGEFHRNQTFKPKNRKVTVKKQIRDIERLLDRPGMPEEIRTKKKAELLILKKDAKKQREANLFESKYKKIKFTEKKKVIRQMERAKGLIKQDKLGQEELKSERAKLKTLQDQLTYINHFPVTQKYISLFPTKDDDLSKKRREEAMVKVLQLAAHKSVVRERDLQEEAAGEGEQAQGYDGPRKTQDDKIFGKDKDVAQLDPFFVEADETAAETIARQQSEVEKRAVMRDGRVPKFQKNLVKAQEKEIEKQAKREGWLQQKDDAKKEEQRKARQHRPLKINAAAFGQGQAQAKATGAAPADASKHNVKF